MDKKTVDQIYLKINQLAEEEFKVQVIEKNGKDFSVKLLKLNHIFSRINRSSFNEALATYQTATSGIKMIGKAKSSDEDENLKILQEIQRAAKGKLFSFKCITKNMDEMLELIYHSTHIVDPWSEKEIQKIY